MAVENDPELAEQHDTDQAGEISRSKHPPERLDEVQLAGNSLHNASRHDGAGDKLPSTLTTVQAALHIVLEIRQRLGQVSNARTMNLEQQDREDAEPVQNGSPRGQATTTHEAFPDDRLSAALNLLKKGFATVDFAKTIISEEMPLGSDEILVKLYHRWTFLLKQHRPQASPMGSPSEFQSISRINASDARNTGVPGSQGNSKESMI
ncbi:hypothetical protein BU23DRAFT_568869 [Bimuria novae-zelandiae CBS 107.79]|uniref:Uncharacterized protein n=1 Tax=Bimuria novae-zelandiae CBS 107.79 TaxID=1447943 RepID=A0A6A5VCB6_9PLEO|nr:hypothetical protein BU23DRAFT_568869 [Bimuria novae-zelandiae CBS 107.79]